MGTEFLEFETFAFMQFVSALVSAFIAERRSGLPLFWFIFGILFGPFAVAVALTAGRRCPHCESIIPKRATVCRHCSRETHF